MVEVIRDGNQAPISTVCNACGCVFRFHRIDEIEDSYTGKMHVPCPQCGNMVRVFNETKRS